MGAPPGAKNKRMNICITVLAIPLQILDRFAGDRFVLQSGETGPSARQISAGSTLARLLAF
jgi:hypothetical protein